MASNKKIDIDTVPVIVDLLSRTGNLNTRFASMESSIAQLSVTAAAAGAAAGTATVDVGTVTTGAPGTQVQVTNSGTNKAASLNFTIPRGNTGLTGPGGTVSLGSITTGAAGSSVAITNTGTPNASVLNFTIPRGDQGIAATVAVNTVATGAPGSSATVSNVGTPGAALFNFTIPRGDVGATGSAATVALGTITTGAAGSAASATNSGSSNAAVFNFTIPRGDVGAQGNAATVAVNSVTTGAPGSAASVTNAGTNTAALLNFTIPRGDIGATGNAATVTVGTVTTGAAGTSVQVTNSGSSSAAVLNFTIPQGAQGPAGSGTGDMLKSENLSGLTDYSAARNNLALGPGSSPTFAGLTSTGPVALGDTATLTTTTASKGFTVSTFNAAGGGNNRFELSGGTAASPSATGSGLVIGTLQFRTYTTALSNAAILRCLSTESGSTGRGSRFEFAVTANGTATPVNTLVLDQDKSATFSGTVNSVGQIITKSGAATSTPSNWVVEALAEEDNTANTALYIHPDTNAQPRVYLGKSGNPVYALNFRYVTALEAVPRFSVADGLQVGYAVGPSHQIGRNGTTTFIQASGASAKIVFAGGSTFGDAVARATLDTTTGALAVTGAVTGSNLSNTNTGDQTIAGLTGNPTAAALSGALNSTIAPVFANITSKPTTLAGYGITDTQPSDNDGTLAANSAARVPTQQAVVSYVQGLISGLSWKNPVRAATTINGALATAYANGQVIDGVTLATNDRILVKNQTTASENGLYKVNASGAPTRTTDADTGSELLNATISVSEGSQAETQWTGTANSPITLGTTALPFVQTGTGAGVVLSANNGTDFANLLTTFNNLLGATSTAVGRQLVSLAGGNSKLVFLNSSGTPSIRGLGTGITDDGSNINVGVLPSPGYNTGRYYISPQILVSGISSQAVVANTIYWTPIIISESQNFDGIGLNVTGTGSGSTQCALYSNIKGKPNNLITTGSLVSIGSTGTVVSTFASMSLPSGVYWLAFASQGTPSISMCSPGDFSAFSGRADMNIASGQPDTVWVQPNGFSGASFPSTGSSATRTTAYTGALLGLRAA